MDPEQLELSRGKIMVVRTYDAILAIAIVGAVTLSACAQMDYGGDKNMSYTRKLVMG